MNASIGIWGLFVESLIVNLDFNNVIKSLFLCLSSSKYINTNKMVKMLIELSEIEIS